MYPLGAGRQIGALGVGGGSRTPVAQPDAAFSFLPFSIYQNGATFNVGDWDISAQVARTTVRYVNKAGNDSTGDGLTVGTAWKTLTKAWTMLAAVSNACVYVGAGRYGWSDGGFNSGTLGITGRSLIATGEVVLDAFFDPGGAWSLTAGKTNTYQKNYAASIDAVLDFGSLDVDGDPTPYTLQASINDVESVVGSFYQTGGVLYVHTLENNSPDTDVRPQYTGQIAPYVNVANITSYWEGLKIYHSNVYMQTNATPNTGIAYFKNCRMAYIAPDPGIRVNGYTAFFQNCVYAHSTNDAVAGNVQNTVIAKIVEIDCTGFDAGVAGNTGKNASTNHNGGINVIINGEYYNTYGPPLGFIQSGKAWILGTNIHDALGSTDFTLLLQEAAWLDTVTISGNPNHISTNTTVYIRNMTPASPTVTGGGSVSSY